MYSHIPELIEVKNFPPRCSDLDPVDFALWGALQQKVVSWKDLEMLVIWSMFCYIVAYDESGHEKGARLTAKMSSHRDQGIQQTCRIVSIYTCS